MPEQEYIREKLAGGTPTQLGELGLDGSGNVMAHNGTAAATIYSTLNPPPTGGTTQQWTGGSASTIFANNTPAIRCGGAS